MTSQVVSEGRGGFVKAGKHLKVEQRPFVPKPDEEKTKDELIAEVQRERDKVSKLRKKVTQQKVQLKNLNTAIIFKNNAYRLANLRYESALNKIGHMRLNLENAERTIGSLVNGGR